MMNVDKKPDIPHLINRIIEEASIPKVEEGMVYKMTRQQLVDLLVYITEVKRTNNELINKIQEMNANAQQ